VVDDEMLRALEHEMGVLVRRIRRVIAERAKLVHPDLSPVAYSMLISLQDNGPRRASDLVELFNVDKGAVSRQVQSLLELGLIERTPDPEDRRAAILAITEAGGDRLQHIAEVRRVELREKLGDWTPEEFQTLVRSLARYNASLE
jgi:DNA-binding MarR family transcriptional regulator